MTTTYTPQAIPADVLKELRAGDDAGRPMRPFTAEEAGAPLRCCLRSAAEGEDIALVSYAPLRRWAAATGVDPGAYDEQGPVFVHAAECDGPGEGYPWTRQGALRAFRRYDAQGRIAGGEMLRIPEDGQAAFDRTLDAAFADPAVVQVHVRAVEYGCFHFAVHRPAA
ncbi:DUF1203 domain-containing protein [Streptomyces sp. NPDC051940]|uniref:DUF1203 domain-containing protein n=1 Tax=Streptomyces sp. NPDC051940 TaxID=3155675 RepID=UPI003423755D